MNPLKVPFVQVHKVIGASMTKVNYKTDMFIVHWRLGVKVKAMSTYKMNESVKLRLKESRH